MTDAIIEAIRSGQWGLAVASAITVLVWLGRRVGLAGFARSHAALWSAGLGTLAAVGVALAAEQPMTASAWLVALAHGVEQGAAASGLWSLVLKRVLPIAEFTT